jgi:hypothetical protein
MDFQASDQRWSMANFSKKEIHIRNSSHIWVPWWKLCSTSSIHKNIKVSHLSEAYRNFTEIDLGSFLKTYVKLCWTSSIHNFTRHFRGSSRNKNSHREITACKPGDPSWSIGKTEQAHVNHQRIGAEITGVYRDVRCDLQKLWDSNRYIPGDCIYGTWEHVNPLFEKFRLW